jgi:hypothetical protein
VVKCDFKVRIFCWEDAAIRCLIGGTVRALNFIFALRKENPCQCNLNNKPGAWKAGLKMMQFRFGLREV